MRDPEDTTRRTISYPEHEITTHVDYSLTAGEYVVVLNPDADRLPSRVKLYLPRSTSQALVRDLAAQQAEADKRNHAEDPERHAAPADPAAAVEQFLADQLARDDMTLREIAAEIVGIATGASAFEPAEDEPAGYEPARLQAEPEPVEWAGRTFGQLTDDEKARVTRQAAGQLQAELQAAAPAIAQVLDDTRWEDPRDTEHGSTEQVRRIPVSQMGSGCPQCGSDLWGFDTSSDEDAGLGVASCGRGHEWIVTEG